VPRGRDLYDTHMTFCVEQNLNISFLVSLGSQNISQLKRPHMLRGIVVYRNRIPKFILSLINFFPIALTAAYLILVTAIILPLAVAICLVLVPLLYVLWRAKTNRFNPTFLRLMYPFELLGNTIVNSPKLVALIVERTGKIKLKRPGMPVFNMPVVHVNRSKTALWAVRILAILGIAGVAIYLVVVAAVVVPLAMGLCICMAPFCYLMWYVKERKFIPLFQKIPVYLEQIGFNIVNSRKIMTNLMLGLKSLNIKWPMF
jgi:hypothetical protein